MRWQMGRRSTNVEDRRGRGFGRGAVGLGGGGLLIILLLALLTGRNPLELLQQVAPTTEMAEPGGSVGPDGFTPTGGSAESFSAEEQELADFSSVVLGDTEDTWRVLFEQMGRTYAEPKLVLYTGAVQSACGFSRSAVGPFYCPGDEKVYLDLSFFHDLRMRHGAPGDFAQAYVIAHEIGHHIQNQLGIMEEFAAMRSRLGEAEANELSVRLELQADFFAGVWAHHANRQRQILEEGDIEEALNAASQIGDDRLQMEAQGYVVPDAFTHGTAEQRARWFRLGLETGDLREGDTFSAPSL